MSDSVEDAAPTTSLVRRRARLDPEERRRILESLFPLEGDRSHWWFRYLIMMALAVTIAVMGLSQNSTAVVIGAMLIAPMMTPVLGLSAGVALALPRRLRLAGEATLVGAVGSVGLSWLLTLLLPGSDRSLTSELLSRTSPDLRDLAIGLAAGAAGAYALSRKDLPAALPGVAVAVALVPPLASVGFALAVGRRDLATGAALLFATNLVAIVFAGTMVFLGVGLVPEWRRVHHSRRIWIGTLVALGALGLIVVPLSTRTISAANHASTTQKVYQAALAWLSADVGAHLDSVDIQGTRVTVSISGASPPPASSALARSLQGVLGSEAAVQIRWFQTGTATSSSSATTQPLSATSLRQLVNEWLGELASRSSVTAITATDSSVVVEISGPTAPPSAATLAELISASEGHSVNVSVDWQATIPSTTTSTSTTTTTIKKTKTTRTTKPRG